MFIRKEEKEGYISFDTFRGYTYVSESKDPWNNYVSGGEGGLARVLAPHHQMEAVQMSRYAQDNVVSKLWLDTLDM